jgi:hypothetical protein
MSFLVQAENETLLVVHHQIQINPGKARPVPALGFQEKSFEMQGNPVSFHADERSLKSPKSAWSAGP